MHGTMKRNVTKKITRCQPHTFVMPSSMPLSIKLKELGEEHRQFPCLVYWPHEMFSTMYHKYREHFCRFIVPGGKERIDSFWQSQQGHDCTSELLLLRFSILMFFPSFFSSLHLMLSVISYALSPLSRPCSFCSYHLRGGTSEKAPLALWSSDHFLPGAI